MRKDKLQQATMVSTVATQNVCHPMGHYSQATVHRGIVYVSGQLALRPDGSHMEDRPLEEQVRQALSNVLAIVQAAGGSAGSILKVTLYLVNVENWPVVNNIYKEFFGDHRPARSVVPVPALHYGYLIEIDAIAAVKPEV